MQNLVSRINGIIERILGASLGKLLRTFQGFLRPVRITEHVDFHAELNNVSIKDSVAYAATNLSEAVVFVKKTDLWDWVCSKVSISNSGGVVLEFGVFQGLSLNHFARNLSPRLICGFDSFFGLEENWTGYNLREGHFSLNGILPKCEPNVELIVGRFQETLIQFLKDRPEINISMIHMDADTYTPTSYVLSVLQPLLKPGVIILFDEFFGYPNWRAHEFRAWEEFLLNCKFTAKPIAFSEYQVAFQLI